MTVSKNGFRAVVCFLLAALMMLTMVSFPGVSALGLNATSATVTKGYALQLKVNGADKATWSSSDKSVATVSSTGKVSGKSVGTAVITANVNGTKLTCNVKVVGGKITLSSKSVTMDEGEVKYVTVRAKGSHGIKAVSGDKSIVTTSWVKPWDKDDIRLKLTAKGAGSTSVKISMTKYPEVYATVSVTVNGDDPVLLTSQTALSTKINENASLVVYSDKDNSVSYSFADNTIAKVTEGTWKDGYCTITVTGLKAGTTTLTLTRKDNANVKKNVTITVAGTVASYYVVCDSTPAKINANDVVFSFKTASGATKYILLPAGYDAAQVNSIVAAYNNAFEYYVVYDQTPRQRYTTDQIQFFTTTVNNQNVKRFVLLPENPDMPSYNTALAEYLGKIEYWTVYNKSPENKKIMSTDVVKSWTTTVNHKLVTRYILLPMNYDEDKLNSIINADAGTSAGGYYGISETTPVPKASTDKIINFEANSKTYYILVPYNYDNGKVNDAIASFKGQYEYWTVYNTKPQTRLAYDIIESWTKMVDGKQITRYMLLPIGYSQSVFEEYKSKDIGSSNSAYYTITTTYPSSINTTDTVWMWFNSKDGVTKYMLLPAKFDALKRNDIVRNDTGVCEYYCIYSAKPAPRANTDAILTPQYNGGTVYMLVPENYDLTKVNQGLAGLLVTN